MLDIKFIRENKELVAESAVKKNAKIDIDALIANIETTEETYWVERLARLAAIDILTIGKVQPETMHHMTALNDEAFAASVKSATVLAKTLNESVRDIEIELGTDLVQD